MRLGLTDSSISKIRNSMKISTVYGGYEDRDGKPLAVGDRVEGWNQGKDKGTGVYGTLTKETVLIVWEGEHPGFYVAWDNGYEGRLMCRQLRKVEPGEEENSSNIKEEDEKVN